MSATNHMRRVEEEQSVTPTVRTIDVAKEFSRVPGGRFIKHGPFSGELFRKNFLVPALSEARRSGGKIMIKLDGAAGYPASFLDEAFAGLIREDGFRADELRNLMQIQANAKRFQLLRDLALSYMASAEPKVS